MEPVANSTAREMIGYIAGYLGCNAVFSRWGELEFRKPCLKSTTGFHKLDEYDIYEGGIAIDSTGSGFPLTPDISREGIGMLISGSGKNEIKYGSGNYCLFANPYIETESALEAIYTDLGFPIKYSPCSISYKGCAVWEVGDTIDVSAGSVSGKVMIMSHTLECSNGGGLKGTIECFGLDSTRQDAIANCNIEKVKLERNISKLESMQDTILGATGGCYDLLLDDYDKPYGTAWWKDASKTAGWKFTYGGLGFFKNNTLQHIGITNDGSVLADNITANSIITNSFTIGKSGSNYAMSFDGETGKITFGSNVTMSWADIADTPTIPSSTSDLTNDSGYITSSSVPSKVSQLTNDSGYITDGDIPSKTSDLTNDSGYITDGDIPSKTSDLTNDSDFINSITATTITKNAISTASISANQITTGTLSADRIGAGSFYMTGGSIQINTDYDDNSIIRLTGAKYFSEMGTGGFFTALNDYSYKCSIDAQTGLYVGDDSGTYSQYGNGGWILEGHSFYVNGSNFMSGCTIEPEGSHNFDLGSTDYYWRNIYCGGSLYCNTVVKSSDRNLKENIVPLADSYVQLFDKLQPVTFKYIDGKRTHAGFISQDVETAMGEVGLTAMDFSGFCKDTITNKDGTTTEKYGLCYSEFVALLTAKIKQLQNRIEVLENGLSTND